MTENIKNSMSNKVEARNSRIYCGGGLWIDSRGGKEGIYG